MSTPVPGCSVWKLSDAAERLYAKHKERKRLKFPGVDIKEYEFALSAFGDCPFGNPYKHEFLLLTMCHQWPSDFLLEREGVVNHWAVRMAKAFCRYKRLNIIGCGSSWKTGNVSAYLYTAWKANPFCTSVFLSTTSGEAAQSRTWGQIKDWHTKDRYTVGKRIESLHLITLDEEARDEEGNKARDFRNSIKVVLIKPGAEGKNVMASIVGRKNEYVYWACDEMCFMDIGILNARVNLNTNPFYQFLGLSNAPEEGDPMYIDAEPAGEEFPDGWRSVDKDTHVEWSTKGGHCVYFNGAKSPNYDAPNPEKPPFRKMMNENIRKEILLDAGGEDTPMYWKQFYGFPPSVDISDKVITFKILEQNGAFGAVEWADALAKPLAGLDLGFRAGGDPCVVHFGKVGKVMSGRRVLGAERDGIALLPAQGSRDPFEVQIAKKVLSACRERGCHDLALDVTGDGGIMLQHIEREARAASYELNVLPVSFSGPAEDRIIIPGERRKANEMFQNMVCQLWASVRLSVLNKVVFGLGERGQCVSQLCSRKMGTDEKKRMTIEPKKEMKKRLRRSPDQGDAFCLLHHLALRHGLDGQQRASGSAEDVVKRVMGQQQRVAGRYGSYGGVERYANR